MRNDWILDVLTDLRSFTEQNGMDATAQQLKILQKVAQAEMFELGAAPQSELVSLNDSGHGTMAGEHPAS